MACVRATSALYTQHSLVTVQYFRVEYGHTGAAPHQKHRMSDSNSIQTNSLMSPACNIARCTDADYVLHISIVSVLARMCDRFYR